MDERLVFSLCVLFQLRLSKANEQLECEKREFALLLEKRDREINNMNGMSALSSRDFNHLSPNQTINPFPNDRFYSSKLKEFGDNYFEFDGNGRRFSNCSLRAISAFPAVFSKELYCRHVKTRACLGKGLERL